jgi:hypothetical protein
MIELIERIPMKEESLLSCHFERNNVQKKSFCRFLGFSRKLREQTTIFSAHRKRLEVMNRVVQDSSRYVA